MKAIHSMIAAAALSFVQPAQAGVNDPEVIIYRVSGVIDDGTVMATSFHCTNFSGVTETVRVVVRASNGGIGANVAVPIPHLNTAILSTHDVFIYVETTTMNTGFFQGTAAIAATSVNVTCTAMQVQSNVTNAVGIALHMTRFNPIPGTQE